MFNRKNGKLLNPVILINQIGRMLGARCLVLGANLRKPWQVNLVLN